MLLCLRKHSASYEAVTETKIKNTKKIQVKKE